jgi:outer membrane biosynthesis protein TonB
MDAERIASEVAEQVKAVIAEAEERAGAIVREAEDEATRIRARAESEGRKRLEEIRSAFDDLQGKLGGSAEAEVTPGPVTVPEPEPPATPEPEPPPVPEPGPEPVPEPSPPPDEGDPPAPDTPAAGNGEAGGDRAAARLVAMKMALDGASREEIDAHIAQNYDVEHREKLLDDVLARAKA